MKKLLLTTLGIASAATAFAQGTVLFHNRLPGTLVAPIYGPNPVIGGPGLSGNSSTGVPVGTTDYAGFELLTGLEWAAQLYAAPGTDLNAALTPQGSPTTFRTYSPGFVNPITVTLTGIAAGAPAAVFQVRVWDTSTGTWDTASLKGASMPFVVHNIGGRFDSPTYLTGLRSFSLPGQIPEPSSLDLTGLAAAGLLFFRGR